MLDTCKFVCLIMIVKDELLQVSVKHMSQAMRKCVLCHMRTTKAQISLCIRAFVVRCLDSIISLDSIAEISRL